MVRKGIAGRLALLAAMLVAAAGPAAAAVIASVDRATVELNESFTLKVTVDTAIDVEPDASALDENFRVGTRSQLSNTTIVGGQISRSRTWTYVLMAKTQGDLVIPPVRIGAEQSEPVPIRVLPPSTNLPGEADIFVTTEVDHSESYVQAQILYRVKVYRAVATRQPRLSDPGMDGVEVLLESAGEERSYESILNGKAYNVVERVYALFPQESGKLSIEPARFEARVLRDGRITGRKIFESDSIEVTVNPIPPPPEGFPDAAWFPAKAVSLTEDWSREPGDLPAGEPITRHIIVTAIGQLSTQIPVIEPEVSPNVKLYPDKPELRDVAESSGIRATRKDQYAMIGVSEGQVRLPALDLPWWNIDAGEWQVASLPGSFLTIAPSANAPVAEPPPPVEPEADAGTATETQIVYVDFWRYVSTGLAGVWVLTVIGWWLSRKPASREPRESALPPLHKLQGRCLKAARKAALEGDGAGVRSAMLEWSRLQWPDDTPRSIGSLAERVSIPLSTELQALCSASYGPGERAWNGEALARALRSFSVLSDDKASRQAETLPPLSPVGG